MLKLINLILKHKINQKKKEFFLFFVLKKCLKRDKIINKQIYKLLNK